LSLFGLFRRRPQIGDAAALADFIDAQAAFLVQKGIYEYARARAGHYAKVLFYEQTFLDAAEAARWCAYPLGLAMVGEVVEGVLRRKTGLDPRIELAALSEIVVAVFDRYPVPAALGAQGWRDARAELVRRLQLIGLHPPKRVIDIPQNFAQDYFDLMPIHEKLRGRDFPTTHNFLKVTLVNVHDELERQLDAPAMAAALAAQAEQTA
jgi:hypothetical protein